MKEYGLISFLFLIFVLHGCSTESTHERKDKISGTWYLIRLSGGFAGLDEDFEKGGIVWEFRDKVGILVVANNHESDALNSGLPSGTYTYSILQGKGGDYLQLNDKEVGRIGVAKSQLILDQNLTSSGSGADGFVMVLIK